MKKYALYNTDGSIEKVVKSTKKPTTSNLNYIEIPLESDVEYKKVDTESQSLTWAVSLGEAKSIVVSEVKSEAQELLEETDWYVVRKQETGEKIPDDVLKEREKIRQKSDEIETEVNGLESVGEVFKYEYISLDGS